MNKLFSVCIALMLIVQSCNDSASKTASNQFNNPEIIRMYELADYRKTSELLPYFTNPDATIRRAAALAFASIQDTTVIPNLITLLEDSDAEVRVAAAYAIGQTPKASSIQNLIAAMAKENDEFVKGQLMEAIGKLTGHNFITDGPGDTTEIGIQFLTDARFETEAERLGWAKGSFWIHISGVIDDRLMNRMPFVMQKTGPDSRVACASAMARYQGGWFNSDKNKKYVMDWCKSERNSDVRIIQMSLLGKINDNASKDVLMGYVLAQSQNTQVRVSAIRAAARNSAVKAADLVILLNEKDDYLVMESLSALSKKEDVQAQLSVISEKCATGNAAKKAYALKLNAMYNEGSSGDMIWKSLNEATEVYDKVHFAKALGACPQKANECISAVMHEEEFALKYALMEVIIEMGHSKNWPASLQFEDVLLEIFAQNDIGCQALIAAELRNSKLSDDQKTNVSELLRSRLSSLTLPKEIETYNEIITTINTLQGEKTALKKAETNHPIDWALVNTIPSTQQAKVTTSKGNFIIDLKVNDAPGSVASFVTLAKSGFYNDKFFHRVIPNFVIQGGCPRGDGMGSTDYTLRSEFALHDYKPGAVGLASSGRDTESCQWFVSHTYTPHLEGRYTIFGYVTSGMEVVNQIMIGDKIVKVELL
jgi:cyclophilin family peptidyl-prolyl cis-trans isomerase